MEGLRDRMKQFALRIVRMSGSLPKETAAQVIGKQVLGSGTGGAAIDTWALSVSSAAYCIHTLLTAMIPMHRMTTRQVTAVNSARILEVEPHLHRAATSILHPAWRFLSRSTTSGCAAARSFVSFGSRAMFPRKISSSTSPASVGFGVVTTTFQSPSRTAHCTLNSGINVSGPSSQ